MGTQESGRENQIKNQWDHKFNLILFINKPVVWWDEEVC
jgi:hypothetical protein